MLDTILELVKEYGPAIGALVLAYYRDQVMAARHQADLADLARQFEEHKVEVEKKYSGKSSADIIKSFAGPSS